VLEIERNPEERATPKATRIRKSMIWKSRNTEEEESELEEPRRAGIRNLPVLVNEKAGVERT
jgi:hypothetical protein